jgi:hypothetical protein
VLGYGCWVLGFGPAPGACVALVPPGAARLARSIHDERRAATLRCKAIGFNAEGAEER